jgi:hypothetical protein
LNGEISCAAAAFGTRTGLFPVLYDARDKTCGRSALSLTEGAGFTSRSRSRSLRSSADLRGGGGDGGLVNGSRGDLRGSDVGVRDRLGILKGLDAPAGEEGAVTRLSGLRKAELSARFSAEALCFGGDEGGSTVREGGRRGRGESGGGGSRDRAGEAGRSWLSSGRGRSVEICNG